MSNDAIVVASWLKLSLIPKAEQQNLDQPEKAIQRVYLGDRLPGVYLTRREAECTYYLMHNMKRLHIAAALGLSRRTIDTYIEAVKKKVCSNSQKELLDTLKETDFLKNIDKLQLAHSSLESAQ